MHPKVKQYLVKAPTKCQAYFVVACDHRNRNELKNFEILISVIATEKQLITTTESSALAQLTIVLIELQ